MASLPPLLGFFVERDALLQRLHQRLIEPAHPDRQRVVCLQGLPGVGKTQIALRYAHAHKGSYRTVLWVEAAGDTPQVKLATAAVRMGVAPAQAPAIEAVQRLDEVLDREGPHLVILDNVDDERAYAEYLRPIGDVRFLVTTRQRHAQLMRFDEIEVPPMAPAEALQVLGHDAPILEAEQEEARRLCEDLFHLPLALDIARSARRFTPISELRQRIRDLGNTVAATSEMPQEWRLFNHPNLYALCAVSYNLLHERIPPPHGENAASLALIIGPFAPVEISAALALQAADQFFPGRTEYEWKTAIANLQSFGLLDYCLEHRAVHCHQMLHEYFRLKGGEPARLAVLRTLSERVREADVIPARIAEVLLPHLNHVQEAAEPLLRGKPEEPIECHRAALGLVRCWSLRGRCAESLELCERLLPELDRRAPELAASYRHQAGWALRQMGRYPEALAFYEASLGWRQQNLDRTRPELHHTLHDIGATLHAQGRYEEAIDRFRPVLGEMEARLAADPRDGHALVGGALLKQAIARSLRAQGGGEYDGKGAEALLQQARGALERAKLARDAWYASVLHDLAKVRMDQAQAAGAGRHDALAMEARQLCDDALVIFAEVVSLNHLFAIAVRNTRGRALLALGDRKAAAQVHAEAVRDAQQVLGEDHPEVATGLLHLALADDPAPAPGAEGAWRPEGGPAGWLGRSLAIRRARLGEDHPDVAACHEGLALLAMRDDPRAALEHFRAALAIWARRPERDRHPAHGMLRVLESKLLDQIGAREEALGACRAAQEILGADHLEVIALRKQLDRPG